MNLRRVAWALVGIGIALFIGGAFVPGNAISRFGLIITLTGFAWVWSLKNWSQR